MSSPSRDDISNPFFVRFYRRNRRSALKRGENEHRRRALDGLTGRVVELGPGDGANFSLYPTTVTEVVAVEPEPRFRHQAEEAARVVEVPVRVVPGTAEARRVIRPGGELRFYEHVHADDKPLRTFLEIADRSRIWPTVAGGCHPTRDTLGAIQAAGFTVEKYERFPFSPSPIIPRIPHILGVARRP